MSAPCCDYWLLLGVRPDVNLGFAVFRSVIGWVVKRNGALTALRRSLLKFCASGSEGFSSGKIPIVLR